MKHLFTFDHVDCGHCASQIEEDLNRQEFVFQARMNFMTKKLMVDSKVQDSQELLAMILPVAQKHAPGIVLAAQNTQVTRWQFEGIDCGSCALEIEEDLKKLEGIDDVQMNFLREQMTLTTSQEVDQGLLDTIHQVGRKVEPEARFFSEAEVEVEEFGQESRGLDQSLKRILISLALYAVGLLGLWQDWLRPLMIGLLLATYVLIGHDILGRTWVNIRNRQWFDENTLMTIATLGALALGEYGEAVTVMLFYQIGEYFQDRAVHQSRNSIREILNIQPETAHVVREGERMEVPAKEVAVGETIEVLVGERVPLDGRLLEGASDVDASALSGESLPVRVEPGQEVFSGSINLTHRMRLEITHGFEDSTVAKIIDLVENATDQKAESERFITRFAKYYTPTVVFAAIALALLPPLITGQAFGPWVHRALVFLVVACPCALVVSVPLSFYAGIGGASKVGILTKGGNYLEALSQVNTLLMDKTGTLTKGNFVVTKTHPLTLSQDELLKMTALVEVHSTHPIAQSVCEAYGKRLDVEAVEQVSEVAGQGLIATYQGQEVLVGNRRLMDAHGVDVSAYQTESTGTLIFTAVDGQLAGWLVIEDEVKPTTAQALQELSKLGIQKTVMLTGDNVAVAEQIGQELGIDRIEAELLPADKIRYVEKYLEGSSQGTVGFVGDGINDAPSLARADVGIAMGGIGSDAAVEAADVVIMNDDLLTLVKGLKISQKTMRIVHQNIFFILAVKFIILGLSLFGYTSMWAAIFADVGVTVLAVLNAMRSLKVA